MQNKHGVLIVGQGFAGCLLAWQLLKKNIPVTVVDANKEFNSTKVAAGIIIPVTGRRLAKTHLADKLLPVAFNTYREIEKFTGSSFFFEKNVLQVFTSLSNLNEWYARSGDPEMQGYCGEVIPHEKMPMGIKNNHGGILLKKSGYVDTLQMTEIIQSFVEDNGKYLSENFQFSDITITGQSANWKGIEYSDIIFCEGYSAIRNPYFNYVPFKPAKGEIIDFTTAVLPDTCIVSNGSIYILPVGDGNFRAGATYEWKDLSETITQSAREYLEENLRKSIGSEFKIIGQQAGIRPAMLDRRPCLGRHPRFARLAMFNGLGTKGALLSPYYANVMAELIVNGVEPDPEVNIRRFDQYYQVP